ncbi:MAG: hypothetical protein LBF19_04700 [Prevotellaceae bacterium]|nr:hypothetical protein [Prevotellaceae bacterium]
MHITTLLNQIYQLPLSDRILIVERTMQSIRAETGKLATAVALMASECPDEKEGTPATKHSAAKNKNKSTTKQNDHHEAVS